MAAPRRPRLKEQDSDEKRLRMQRGTLTWIRDRLRRKGVNEGTLRVLATAYDAHQAGAGMVDEVERAIADRPQLLVAAIEQSEKTHALLHRIFGGVPQRIDLRVRWSAEERRALSSGKVKTKRGATSKRLEPIGNEPCDVKSGGRCGTIYPEVRQHAEFCRFLRRELEEARALPKARSDLRAEVETFPILKSKGAIANFLLVDIGVPVADIALFTLVHGDAALELPVSRQRITSRSHAISVALSEWRRCQAKTSRARKT